MTDRQIEKELNRQMVLFDEECRGSSLRDGHIKLQTFAEQWDEGVCGTESCPADKAKL